MLASARSDGIHGAAWRIARAGLWLTLAAANLSSAQSTGRLIEVVEANDAERNVNVLVQARCRLQYLSHDPQDLGAQVTVRLRLAPDCGPAAPLSERPPITGSSGILRSVRTEDQGLGQVTVTLEWSGKLNFVLAPTTNGRGLRLRLLDALPGRRGQVLLDDRSPLAGYAINLESSTTAVTPQALADSAAFLQLPTYVSRVELEGLTFYRLRAGPLMQRRDAERVLALAQQRYPRAWLGINDEPDATGLDAVAQVPASVQATPVIDPPLPEADRTALLETARRAMARKDYPRAIAALTKLTRQVEFDQRARAQEMLGLARERAGQLAHAKAEYAEYLRRYPQGEAAARLRYRLRLLSSTARRGRSGTGGAGGAFEDDGRWHLAGGASQFYRWERLSLTAPETSLDRQTQNALYTDGDFIARRRGARFDTIARISAGYAKDMLQDGPGDVARVAAAFFELSDRALGLSGRIGRQTRNSGGLLGTFDGLHASWQARPRMALSVSAGLPVESTRESPNSDRQFFGVAADFGPFKDRWDLGTYAIVQSYSGETDRRALGLEARYFVPGRTLVGMVDFDTYYQALNSALLMGSVQLPARWLISFNLDHRRAPVLTTRNALIGQSMATLDGLLGIYTSAELQALAEDRTPLSDLYSLSVSRPVGERWQVSLDAFATRIGATPASGGVAATPQLPLEQNLQLQLIGSSLWRSSDLWSIAARFQDSARQQVESVALATRLPLGQAWRVGPRLRVDRIRSTAEESRETLFVPGLRVDYQRGGNWIELEGGAEIGRRTIPTENEQSRRYYLSLGYRITF